MTDAQKKTGFFAALALFYPLAPPFNVYRILASVPKLEI